MTATIYLDAISPSFRLTIEVAVSRGPWHQVTYRDCRPHGLVHAWRLSQHDTTHRLASHADWVCFVTEHQTIADADVCFALYCARIPVLTLQPCDSTHPLLLSPWQLPSFHTDLSEVDTDAVADANASPYRDKLVHDFFDLTPSPSQSESRGGRVVVFEGGDGCGKATQTALLMRRLQAGNSHRATDDKSSSSDDSTCECSTLDFPYERGLYGGLIRVLLSGKRGKLSELDPRLFSLVYTLNRYGCLPELRYWLQHGRTVVLDRYYTANFGHQASKLPVEERKAFIHTQEQMEVDLFGLPRAGKVFYLDLSPKAAWEAMQQDSARDYLDIHETAGGDYKERVRMSYRWCCDNLAGWHMIPCCDVNGNRLSREELHEKIYQLYCNL